MLTRTILAASAAALAMTVGGNAALATPLMTEADFESAIDEDFSSLSDDPRTLSSVDVGIGSGTELTESNAGTDDNPSSFESWVNVDIDPATNGITVSVKHPSLPIIPVEFVEVLIDNIEFDSPAVIAAIVDDTDNLAQSNPFLPFDLTAEVLPGNQISIRWEADNVNNFFNVNVDSEASFTLEVEPVAEPGSLALVATALVAGGVMGARRLRRPS